jgi:outer membrane protein assembly factor BamE (lipoprotein component of BamABCDE complex)
MRRFLCTAAAVLFVLAGCCGAPQPELSIAKIFPQAPEEGFALADPEYALYDLSKLRVGMTRAEVRGLFAKPHVVKQAPKDEYWEYDWFELYFREGRLVNWFDLPATRQKFRPILKQ